MTYKKLSLIDNLPEFLELNKSDFIVLDEYHRCGAKTWLAPVKELLSLSSNIKVLGTTATPIRFLDNSRNMTQEIFGIEPISELSLASAIQNDILPSPKYILSYYNLDSEIDYVGEVNKLLAEIEELISRNSTNQKNHDKIRTLQEFN